MIVFLFKGLIRDRSRSMMPLLTVIAGVMLTVLMYCWVKGTETEIIQASANFSTGHVKVMSRAYAQNDDQVPNDLAYFGVAQLIAKMDQDFDGMVWTPRIRFGGLLDIPDEYGETRSQGPVAGIAVDLLSPKSPEKEILNLDEALTSGRMPERSGEILISEEFAELLAVEIGETATLVSSTMYGSMTTYNFIIVGTVRFGISAMDRGAMLIDITDAQYALDMNDAAGEILGFFDDHIYRDEQAQVMAVSFNEEYTDPDDEFSPVMLALREQGGLSQTLDMASAVSTVVIAIFVVVMSIVLWNAGLMGSLRRYGEIGVRLAIGEEKGHIYRTLIIEALMIGAVGSLLGTGLGIAFSYYLQVQGLDISAVLQNASMIISDVMRAQVTPTSFVIGFVPGLLATFLGTAISGLGIYRRQTSQLAKEFES
ncbi:MAG: FtsX-like permease family protein [candidate division WOR-3 bacterium]